jgi:hypothetical protein
MLISVVGFLQNDRANRAVNFSRFHVIHLNYKTFSLRVDFQSGITKAPLVHIVQPNDQTIFQVCFNLAVRCVQHFGRLVNKYQVLLDDSVSVNELYENYEVIEQEGITFWVEDKRDDE